LHPPPPRRPATHHQCRRLSFRCKRRVMMSERRYINCNCAILRREISNATEFPFALSTVLQQTMLPLLHANEARTKIVSSAGFSVYVVRVNVTSPMHNNIHQFSSPFLPVLAHFYSPRTFVRRFKPNHKVSVFVGPDATNGQKQTSVNRSIANKIQFIAILQPCYSSVTAQM
jgi:hypothetical protein